MKYIQYKSVEYTCILLRYRKDRYLSELNSPLSPADKIETIKRVENLKTVEILHEP